ncbi:hypothetical protein L873DRAFT_1842611 [Choiromyces venosus 120613-1]|uniref:Uncharacterized protein n=1 Tax=Choiromyces venosus 120613-1 TaxID=1336337 RepID=A0A3N4JXS8_9PEZI|nr:hypothetical protein L873DRAFT_1842611 [Choiromyces venosus 120613-1]
MVTMYLEPAVLVSFFHYAQTVSPANGNLNLLLQGYLSQISEVFTSKIFPGSSIPAFETPEDGGKWAENQIWLLESMVFKFIKLIGDHKLFAAKQECDFSVEPDQEFDYSRETACLSPEDKRHVERFVFAIQDKSGLTDYQDTKSYDANIEIDEAHKLAIKIMKRIDSWHKNNDIFEGMTRQARIEGVIGFLTRCKSSVTKMMDVPFYEACLKHPGFMEKRHRVNQKINHQRKVKNREEKIKQGKARAQRPYSKPGQISEAPRQRRFTTESPRPVAAQEGGDEMEIVSRSRVQTNTNFNPSNSESSGSKQYGRKRNTFPGISSEYTHAAQAQYFGTLPERRHNSLPGIPSVYHPSFPQTPQMTEGFLNASGTTSSNTMASLPELFAEPMDNLSLDHIVNSAADSAVNQYPPGQEPSSPFSGVDKAAELWNIYQPYYEEPDSYGRPDYEDFMHPPERLRHSVLCVRD